MEVVPFDLLIENRQLVDVYTYEIYQAAFGIVKNSCMPFRELRNNSELEKQNTLMITFLSLPAIPSVRVTDRGLLLISRILCHCSCKQALIC